MESAVVLSDAEVRKIIAKAYGVDEKQVVRMQYSYVVKGITGAQIEAIRDSSKA